MESDRAHVLPDWTGVVAYSEELAARMREVIGGRDGVSERKMFGGIAWMVNGNMACGTLGDDMMVRLDVEDAERALREPHVGPMARLHQGAGGGDRCAHRPRTVGRCRSVACRVAAREVIALLVARSVDWSGAR
jgi:hypothetical protein